MRIRGIGIRGTIEHVFKFSNRLLEVLVLLILLREELVGLVLEGCRTNDRLFGATALTAEARGSIVTLIAWVTIPKTSVRVGRLTLSFAFGFTKRHVEMRSVMTAETLGRLQAAKQEPVLRTFDTTMLWCSRDAPTTPSCRSRDGNCKPTLQSATQEFDPNTFLAS